MNFASILKAPKLAAVAGAALVALAPHVAQADALAQSYLNISNFLIGTTGQVNVTAGVTSGDVSASINNLPAVTDTSNGPPNFNLKVQQGPDAASYNPGVAILGVSALNYAGSASSVSGNALLGSATAKVDNTVSLFPGGVGSSQSNTQLDAAYNLSIAQSGSLSFSFEAEGFLRAMLSGAMPGFPAGVNASYNWSVTIFTDPDVGNAVKVFEWTPDGVLGTGIVGGTETLDGFDLSDGRNRLFNGSSSTGVQTGSFAASTGLLAAGNYTLTIVHRSVADAQVVSEPAALSLLGLALLGAGVASRRRRA